MLSSGAPKVEATRAAEAVALSEIVAAPRVVEPAPAAEPRLARVLGPRRRDASPASPASLGGADRWERKSPAPTPAATVLRGWNRTPEQPMPGAQPLPGLIDTTARKSAPTDDDSEDEGWGR